MLAGYAGVYLGLAALHAPLLRLSYYWDEAGYFIFAGLDFFRHGWLAPRTTLANGHPPLLAVYLALAWTVAGFHRVTTRLAMLVWAAALVGGVYRLAERRLGRRAVVSALLVALTPLVFAQSTLAQLDLPAAALIVWALVWRERGRRWTAAGLFAAACLMKETALLAPAVVWLFDTPAPRLRRAGEVLLPAAALGAWYVYFHHATGYWIGNPEYVAYNVGQAAFSLPRIGLALLRRVWQLGLYDGTGPLTALAAYAAWRAQPHAGAGAGRRWRWFWPLIAAYVVAHAVVGGAVLARYLLPALALYYVWLGEQITRLRGARWWVPAAAAWLVAAWFWNPPYPFPYEDNLAYATFVRLHEAAARELEAHPPAGPVWTAWPATDELTRPELGYVRHPLAVRRLEDFSAASLRALPPHPAALYLFSRVYEPGVDAAAALPFWWRWSERYFGYQPPAPPAAWLARAREAPWYARARGGQWVVLAQGGAIRGALRRPRSAGRRHVRFCTLLGRPRCVLASLASRPFLRAARGGAGWAATRSAGRPRG